MLQFTVRCSVSILSFTKDNSGIPIFIESQGLFSTKIMPTYLQILSYNFHVSQSDKKLHKNVVRSCT